MESKAKNKKAAGTSISIIPNQTDACFDVWNGSLNNNII